MAEKKKITYWERMTRRLGSQVFENALRAKDSVTRPKLSIVFISAQVVSLIILLPPVLFAGLAIIAILYDFPNYFMFLVAAILLVLAWFLWPERSKNDQKTYYRKDLPELFALIDRIASELNADKIDGLHIFKGNNAYYTEYKRPNEHILGIGALLWQSATPQERVALIAHELGHSVSQDPARTTLLSKAIYAIHQWRIVLDYDQLELNITWYFLILFYWISNLILNFLDVLLTRLFFWESQASEYRADRCAIEVAGVNACRSLLEKLMLRDLIDNRAAELYVTLKVTPKELLAQLDGTVANPDFELRSKLMDEVREVDHTIDATHPPTHYRIKYAESFKEQKPLIVVNQIEANKINLEMAAFV